MKDEERNKWYELGKVAHAESMSPYFKRLAGEAYAGGMDNEAKIYRSLAQEFEHEAKNLRADYEAKYPKEKR